MANPYERHVFICVNRRDPSDPKPSCGPREADQVFMRFKEEMDNHSEIWGKVRINYCNCLGPCDVGPTLVVSPEGVWYHQIKPEDVKEIVEGHLVGGQPVERLMMAWPE